jgi:hypothetical protein
VTDDPPLPLSVHASRTFEFVTAVGVGVLDREVEHLYAIIEPGSALCRANRRTDGRGHSANAFELAHDLGSARA